MSPAFKPPKVPGASTPPRKNELRDGAGGRAAHDVGGLDFGPVDRHEHDLAQWEQRVDAMAILMVGRKAAAYTLDAKRRVIEDYGEQQYDATTYYEKWVRAIRNLMVEQDIAKPAEIEAKMADVAKRMKASGRPVGDLSIPWEPHHHAASAKSVPKAIKKRKPKPEVTP
jgi:Nitrile hydratase beta subunit